MKHIYIILVSIICMISTSHVVQAQRKGQIFSSNTINVTSASGTFYAPRHNTNPLNLISADSWINVDPSTLNPGVPNVGFNYSSNSSGTRSGFIVVQDIYGGIDQLLVIQAAGQESPPSGPTPPSVSYNNGNTILTRGAPPSNVTYYWQTSSSGTSTSNSASTKSFTSNGTYYLRAKHNISGLWSSARSGSVTVFTNPAIPSSASASYAHAQTVMTRPSSPSGITYYWQTSSGGSITSSATVNHGSSKTFYMTPSTGYHVKRVLVDGSSVGSPTSYTFQDVTSNHTISVVL